MGENQFGGMQKVAGQATVLAHWTQKVGGRLAGPCQIGSAANGAM